MSHLFNVLSGRLATNLEKEILDLAVRIGVEAKRDNLPPTQLEHLISSLESVEDDRNSLLVCAVFAHRQANRLGKGYRTARVVAEAMRRLYELNRGREDARKLLGLAKWVFESAKVIQIPREGVKSLEDYIRLLVGRTSR